MSLLLALLAQIGPYGSIGDQSVSPLPREDIQHQEMERKKKAQEHGSDGPLIDLPPPLDPTMTPEAAAAQARHADAPAPATKLSACMAMVSEDSAAAEEVAKDWLKQAKGVEQAEAGQCVGAALAAQEDFANARTAFLLARDAAAPANRTQRARLGAMAGNAALADNDAAGALGLLNTARSDAGAANEQKLVSGIATDRARALVALKRDSEAMGALDDARSADPTNAEAWLLSATLSRRSGMLATAQTQIEQAAKLLPVDPEIGLEAGVVAVLAGHDEAARKSWESVLEMAPQSDAAKTANTYLAQLGPATHAAAKPLEAGR